MGHACFTPRALKPSTHGAWKTWEHGKVHSEDEVDASDSKHIAQSPHSSELAPGPELRFETSPESSALGRRSSGVTQNCLWPPGFRFQCWTWQARPQ